MSPSRKHCRPFASTSGVRGTVAIILLLALGERASAQAFGVESEPIGYRSGAHLHSASAFSSSLCPNSTVADLAMSEEAVGLARDSVSMPGATTKAPGSKSVLLAGVLSLVVPGLGEYYVGDEIWRGMIFSAVEVGGWLGKAHWTSRGDDSTAAFRAYGDAHFSTYTYANYLNGLLKGRGIDSVANGASIPSINVAESMLDSLHFTDFTHRLSANDRQQYYELISKYYQFRPGWDDFVSLDIYPPHDNRHADMRDNMNYQYQVADYFFYGIVVNHVLSAIDAALLARDHNRHLHLVGDLQQRTLPNGSLGYIPTARISYTF